MGDLFRPPIHFVYRLFQDLLRVILCVDFVDYLGEDSVFVEDEGLTESSHIFLTVQGLLSPRSEGLNHFCRRICQERKRKVILCSKVFMRLHAILADSDYIVTLCYHCLIVVTKVAGFLSTSAGVVLRIEIDYGLFSYKVI